MRLTRIIKRIRVSTRLSWTASEECKSPWSAHPMLAIHLRAFIYAFNNNIPTECICNSKSGSFNCQMKSLPTHLFNARSHSMQILDRQITNWALTFVRRSICGGRLEFTELCSSKVSTERQYQQTWHECPPPEIRECMADVRNRNAVSIRVNRKEIEGWS